MNTYDQKMLENTSFTKVAKMVLAYMKRKLKENEGTFIALV
jgi:hypothetical protein